MKKNFVSVNNGKETETIERKIGNEDTCEINTILASVNISVHWCSVGWLQKKHTFIYTMYLDVILFIPQLDSDHLKSY